MANCEGNRLTRLGVVNQLFTKKIIETSRPELRVCVQRACSHQYLCTALLVVTWPVTADGS